MPLDVQKVQTFINATGGAEALEKVLLYQMFKCRDEF